MIISQIIKQTRYIQISHLKVRYLGLRCTQTWPILQRIVIYFELPFEGSKLSSLIDASQCFHRLIYRESDLVKKPLYANGNKTQRDGLPTLAPPNTTVRTENVTCTIASMKIKMCRWCNASSDNNGTLFCWRKNVENKQ